MIINTQIPEVFIFVPKIFNDDRGYLFESLSIRTLKNEAGIDFTPVQQNTIFSFKKGTVRGLHFQMNPHAQAKLVRCTKGSIMDFAVDLRKGSPSYLKYVSQELSFKNGKQLFLPKGFAHGCISLEDNTEIQYFTDDFYAPECDCSIRYNDLSIGIEWGISEMFLSEKDRTAPFITKSDCYFE